MKIQSYVEFYGEQVSTAELEAEAKKIWVEAGHKASELIKLELYIKPEDDRCYYVFNGQETGSFHIVNTQNDF